MGSLDELDCGIIALLQEDARMSSRAIAQRLGAVSDRVVRFRIKRLLDGGVVLVQAVVDPRRVGYPVIADIVADVLPDRLAAVCARVVGMRAVASVSASPNGRQLSIQVNARDERELAVLAEQTLRQMDGVLRVQAMTVPLLIKDLAFWRPPEVAAYAEAHGLAAGASPGRAGPRQTSVAGASDDLDDLDRQVIALLREDPRTPSREMAHRLGDISDRVVRYRIKRLLERRVVLLQARVDPHRVGFSVVADVLLEVVPWRRAGVCESLAAWDPVCYISSALAGRDSRELSIEVNMRNERELASFGERLTRVDGIVSARTVVVPRLVKDVAFWEVPR